MELKILGLIIFLIPRANDAEGDEGGCDAAGEHHGYQHQVEVFLGPKKLKSQMRNFFSFGCPSREACKGIWGVVIAAFCYLS